MAQALHNLGFEVEVVAPKNPKLSSAEFPYKVREISCKGTQDWSSRLVTGLQMLRMRKQLRNCILYLPEPGPIRMLTYLKIFSDLNPQKIILTLHGSEINRLSVFSHRRLLFMQLLNQCYRITVPSNYTYQMVIDKFPMTKSKLILTPGALRSSLNIPQNYTQKINDQFTIVTVARIHPRKGQHFVLKAINALDSQTKNRIVYRMIGPTIDKQYRKELKNYSAKNKINLEIVGEVGDRELAEIYQHADLFAMTSHAYGHSIEGFGLSYLEASAYGLPILAHKTGGVEDAVKDGVNGLLANPGDLKALTQALNRLIIDVNLRRSLADGGRKWVRQFSWENNAIAAFGHCPQKNYR